LDEYTIDYTICAGKLHDLGKINVPSEILNKPSRLTDDEYNLLKRHTQDGYDLLKSEPDSSGIEELINGVAEVMIQHHERLDGSGYPFGLKGDEICMGAKILAVVDSYEAMISKRTYKEAYAKEKALSDLKKHVNTWYDPLVVEKLEEIIDYI